VRNPYNLEWETRKHEIKRFPEQMIYSARAGVTDYVGARGDCDPARTFMPAGQGMGLIHEIRPAADVMQEIVVDARETLARLGHLA